MRKDPTFEFGGQWLGRLRDADGNLRSPYWYRCWYDDRDRQTRRKSLGETDFDEATKALVAHVLAESRPRDAKPTETLLVVMLDRYLQHAEALASYGSAKAAARWLLEFFGDTALVSDFTPERQREFMRFCRDQGHSVAYIARNLATASAAFGLAKKREELIRAPQIMFRESVVAEVLDMPTPEPREKIPTLEEAARFFDAIQEEHVFRYAMFAVNTGARPEQVTDFTRFQILPEDRLLNLNPPGRRQNKKYRPIVRATDCLWGWLEHWEGERVVSYKGRPVASVRKSYEKTWRSIGLSMNRYALRHLVGTELRRRKVPVDQIAWQLGHRRQEYRMTERYTKFGPEFLAEAKEAIDAMMAEIQGHAQRRLFAPNTVVAFKLRSSRKKKGSARGS